MLVGVLVTACNPVPSPSPATPNLTSGTVAPSSVIPATSSPEVSSQGPAGKIAQTFAITATLVAARGDEVWYIRQGNVGAVVGHIAPGSATPVERPAGPYPTGIAATPDAVFLLESVPDTGKHGDARTNVVERLDPTTLKVVATAPVPGLPTDILVADDLVWVAGVGGDLRSFEAATLRQVWTGTLRGEGSGDLGESPGSIWLLNGSVQDDLFFVHRIDPAEPAHSMAFSVPGSGTTGALAVGERVWVSTPEDNARALIYPLTYDGTVGPSVSTPRPTKLAAGEGRLWWATQDGEVNRIDEQTLDRTLPISAGSFATDIAISDGRVWVAGEQLVKVMP